MNRQDFPILNELVYGKRLVYLDNAATTQKPQSVIDSIIDAYSHWNANVHRGVHHLSAVSTSNYEQARRELASFIGANEPEELIFTRGTTESLNLLAFSFGEMFVEEGDEIIVSGLEHHSNIVPWQMMCQRKKAVLRVLPIGEDGVIDISALEALLSTRTKLVSIAHVSNVLGTLQPVKQIIDICHKCGVPVCIDGAQSAPHLAIDVKDLDCDFFVCSGHKMYGPTGIGLLYGKRQCLEQLPPYQGGGEMIDHVRWSGTTYNTLPYRLEAGTPNYIGAYALAQAVRYMREVGSQVVSMHEQSLTEYAEKQLLAIDGVRVYAQGSRKVGALSFNAYTPGGTLIHPFDIGTLLDRQGVAVRTGHHCAEPLIDTLGVPGTVRISFAMYNDTDDVDVFITALYRSIQMLS